MIRFKEYLKRGIPNQLTYEDLSEIHRMAFLTEKGYYDENPELFQRQKEKAEKWNMEEPAKFDELERLLRSHGIHDRFFRNIITD